jgi:hypothetical protein
MANNSSVHKVASYNISFASDLGTFAFGSEKHFVNDALKRLDALGRREELVKYGKRAAWENAAQLVRNFWMNQDPSAMGLQEMNTSEKLDKKSENGTVTKFPGGVRRLQEVLTDIPNLGFYANGIAVGSNFPTLLTIWNTEKLGNHTHDYVADLGEEDGFNKHTYHKGRPITIVYTDKGFTLINLHGPNWSEESYKGNMEFLRAAINKHVVQFFEKNQSPILNSNKLFVMGDFNDPFNAIKHSQPLVIEAIPLYYNNSDTEAVKSCCYNFNSSCSDKDLNLDGELPNYNQGERVTRADGKKADPYECFIRMDPNKDLDETLGGKVKKSAYEKINGKLLKLSVGPRGYIYNYRFTGDYVMGAKVAESLQTYRPEGFRTPYSLESDHEMVFASFRSDAVAGGRRKRRTRHKKHTQRRTRHKRHTRRK